MNKSNVWNDYWSSYGVNLFGRRLHKEQENAIKRILKGIKFKSVLDIGCGSGRTMKIFLSMHKDVKGVDISKVAIEMCKKQGLDVAKSDFLKVKGKFDMVFSDGVLEHYDVSFLDVVEQMCKLSQKYVLVAQPNTKSLFGFIAGILDVSRVEEYDYCFDDYMKCFRLYGFKLVKSSQYNFSEGIIMLFVRHPNE